MLYGEEGLWYIPGEIFASLELDSLQIEKPRVDYPGLFVFIPIAIGTGLIAQSVEQSVVNAQVDGSCPSVSS
jgi:hypothetical protein